MIVKDTGLEKFCLFKEFDFKFFTPIVRYLEFKIEHQQWDDYNELFHATGLIESLKTKQNTWFDTHIIQKNDCIIGVMIIIGGEISQIENRYLIQDENKSLLMKYFHISEKGKGYGSYWLNNIIKPYYHQKGFHYMYVNSSHTASFPFYSRHGICIHGYKQPSDNSLYLRDGRSFLISL